MKTSKNKAFNSLKSTNNKDLASFKFLKHCETLHQAKQEICETIYFYTHIEEQINQGKQFQWHLGKMFSYDSYEVSKKLKIANSVADKLGYRVIKQNGAFTLLS
jgi:hypothetical protein